MSDFNSGFLIGVLASLLFALFVIQIMYWKNKIKAAIAAFKKPKNTAADANADAAIAAIKAGRQTQRKRKQAPAAPTPAMAAPMPTPMPAPMLTPTEDEGYWESLASDCGWEQDDGGRGFNQDYYDLG